MKYKGFSLVELLLVMAIVATLAMIVSVNLFSTKQKTSLSTTIQSLMSDIKQQQVKAMNGQSYQGIYFPSGQNAYILFDGDTYNVSNTTNFTINLGDQISVGSIDLANRQLIFIPASGEVDDFVSGSDSIVLINTTSNETKTITFNKFGVVTNVQ